jgi:hypothetical protein
MCNFFLRSLGPDIDRTGPDIDRTPQFEYYFVQGSFGSRGCYSEGQATERTGCNGLFRTASLQKCVATRTRPALLITCVRVILVSSDAQCVVVTGGTMKANTFKATRPCGILQAAA